MYKRQFLHQYHNYGYFFRDLIATVHLVVTDTASPGDPQWNAGEDKVRQAEHPLEVLEDYKAFVHRALKPMTTPTVYIVSKRGYVMHEGLLNDVDLWGAFDAVGRLRRGEFR